MKTTIFFLIAFFMTNVAFAGMDFRWLAGRGPALREETQRLIYAVNTKNREQAQVAYERVQEIIQSLPDKSKNAELMNEYLEIIEKARLLSQEAQEISEAESMRLMFLVSEQGAYIVTQSVPTKKERT